MSDEEEEFLAQEWESSDEKFAMQVSDDSMIEEHIAEGDFVILRNQDTAKDGEIAAILNDDGIASLRRFFRERNRVRLEPANKAMSPTYRDSVKVLGVLVGVVRKYH